MGLGAGFFAETICRERKSKHNNRTIGEGVFFKCEQVFYSSCESWIYRLGVAVHFQKSAAVFLWYYAHYPFEMPVEVGKVIEAAFVADL